MEILTDEPASFNFTASLYHLEMGKPNIVLLNHIDVVPATREVSEITGAGITEFTVTPLMENPGGRPCHEWLIEFS